MWSLPINPAAVDGLFALASVLHVPEEDVDGTLEESVRVLAHGGVMMLVTRRPGADAGESPYGERDRRHVEYYEPDPLRDRLERAGFVVHRMDPTEDWLPIHAHLE